MFPNPKSAYETSALPHVATAVSWNIWRLQQFANILEFVILLQNEFVKLQHLTLRLHVRDRKAEGFPQNKDFSKIYYVTNDLKNAGKFMKKNNPPPFTQM